MKSIFWLSVLGVAALTAALKNAQPNTFDVFIKNGTVYDGSGGQGTIAFNINAPGAITGPYVDGSDVNHGFLRAKNGAITTFDVPGAGTGPGQGTIPSCNNPVDAITSPACPHGDWFQATSGTPEFTTIEGLHVCKL